MNVVNQLKIYGQDIKDHTLVEKVLISLSTKFDVVVTTIEEAKYLATLTVDKFMGSRLSHEARIDKKKGFDFRNRFKNSCFYFKRQRSRKI